MVSIFRAAIITAFAHKMVRVHCAMLLWLNVAIRQSTPHAKKNSNYSFDENRRRKSEDIRKRAMAGRQPQKFQPQNLHCIQNSIVLCARTFFICHENVSADWCMFRLFLICSRATFVRSARATGTHTHTPFRCPIGFSFSHSHAVELFRTMLCPSKYQTVENL